MRNATYLTDLYPGQESQLWTPCIESFFRKHAPIIPVSICIDAPSDKGPWFEDCKHSPSIKIIGELLREPGPDEFLPLIGARFGVDLINNPGRILTKGDIAGIYPDIVLLKPDQQGVSIIENKPYYGSTFDGNQCIDGAYIDFIVWLNDLGIPCEYLLIHSISWKQYTMVKEIQRVLNDRFGILLLEDIFAGMAKEHFKYDAVKESWSEYTEKGNDYA